MDKEIFDQIATSIADPKLAGRAGTLAKNYKPTVTAELEGASDLAYDLYLREYIEEALQVCDLLGEVLFTGNHNLWTPVQSALLLGCWISIERKDEAGTAGYLKKITDAFDFQYEREMTTRINAKARQRQLDGGGLNYDQIDSAIAAGDRKAELAWRVAQVKKLLFIYVLGGSEPVPAPRAQQEIKENLEIIRQLI